MNLLIISTSRSEFGQLAPLAREAMAQGHRARLVVTGMHHDSRTPTPGGGSIRLVASYSRKAAAPLGAAFWM